MTRRSVPTLAFYDGPVDIGPLELERIVQGLLWLGDAVLLPTYARPSRLIAKPDRAHVANKLSQLAEAQFIRPWTIERMPDRLIRASWWPAGTDNSEMPWERYTEMQQLVTEGVARQKADLVRGLGREAGSLVSGIAELVSLRETLTTLGVARFFAADVLVSSSTRSASLVAPLKLLREADLVEGPITDTLLKMNGITGLGFLSMRDIKRLRKRGETVRGFVDAVSRELEYDRPLVGDGRYLELLDAVAVAHFAAVARGYVADKEKAGHATTIAGVAMTLAGTVFPPLSVAGFAQPLVEWNPSGRERRRLLVFLTKLKKTTGKRAGHESS